MGTSSRTDVLLPKATSHDQLVIDTVRDDPGSYLVIATQSPSKTARNLRCVGYLFQKVRSRVFKPCLAWPPINNNIFLRGGKPQTSDWWTPLLISMSSPSQNSLKRKSSGFAAVSWRFCLYVTLTRPLNLIIELLAALYPHSYCLHYLFIYCIFSFTFRLP